jgi:acetyltransferase-like isoleucine patch superfamily enzyme
MASDIRIAESADVDDRASIGSGSVIWHLSQIREEAVIGKNCIVGRGAYIGSGVTIGENSKIQNFALVYEPARLADGVFIGPAVVLTNDTYPRAITPDGFRKGGTDWEAVGVKIGRGASIGARAVCVAPLTIGEWALIAAGSVVIENVKDHALIAGVPGKQIGWVGKSARKLVAEGEYLVDPVTTERYVERDGHLQQLEENN